MTDMLTREELTSAERNRFDNANRVIPSRKDVEATFALNRLIQEEKKSRYGQMIQNERKKDYKDISKKDDFKNPEKDYFWIARAPNSRYHWIHQLIQYGESGKKLSPIDLAYMDSFWMLKEDIEAMKKYFSEKYGIEKEAKAFSVQPPINPSKSPFMPVVRQGQLKYALANPGILNLNLSTDLLKRLRGLPPSDYTDLNNAIHNLVLDWPREEGSNKPSVQELEKVANDIVESIASADTTVVDVLDKPLVRALIDLKERVMLNKLSLKSLFDIVKIIQFYTAQEKDLYIAALLDPFRVMEAKIPAIMPLPTSSFTVRSFNTITANASGNAAFSFQPFGFFSMGASAISGYAVNNAATLLGNASDNNFVAIDVNMTQPAGIYQAYRLVSGAIRCKCIASQLNSSGYLTMGCYLGADPSYYNNVSATVAALAPYGQFSLIDNLYYHQTIAAAQGATLTGRYLPKDESYYDFQATGTPKAFAVIGYISGVAASSPCLRIEVVMNIEATVAPTYTDFIPMSTSQGDPTTLKSVHTIIPPTASVTTAQEDEKFSGEKLIQPDKMIAPQYRGTYQLMDKPIDEKTPIPIPTTPAVKKSLWDSALDALSDIGSKLIEKAPGWIAGMF